MSLNQEQRAVSICNNCKNQFSFLKHPYKSDKSVFFDGFWSTFLAASPVFHHCRAWWPHIGRLAVDVAGNARTNAFPAPGPLGKVWKKHMKEMKVVVCWLLYPQVYHYATVELRMR